MKEEIRNHERLAYLQYLFGIAKLIGDKEILKKRLNKQLGPDVYVNNVIQYNENQPFVRIVIRPEK